MEENEEKKISTIAYNESYFMFKKLISEIFLIPLIIYIISISIITHISLFNQPLRAEINSYLAKKRKILYLILIFLYIGEIIYILRISSLDSTPTSVSSNKTLITLLFYITDIMAVLLTVYFIDEMNKKQINTDKRNPLLLFIAMNIIYFLLDLVNEIIYGLFTLWTPFTFCFLIYFQIFYYQNPNDIDEAPFSSGAKFIAFNEYHKDLLINKKSSIKKYELNNLITKKYIPMTNLSGRISMIGSNSNLNNEENSNNKDYDKNNYNEGIKINRFINNLDEPNNTDYLRNSYDGLLQISVKFQSNFFMNYENFDINYNENKADRANSNKSNSENEKEIPLLNKQKEDENNFENQKEDKNVADFYTSIIFNFNVIATSSYYVTNKNLSKSLAEFFELENIIENEFTDDRYNQDLIKNLPKLNMKKSFDELSNNFKESINIGINNIKNNSDSNDALDCIKNAKNVCEKYINDLVSNPHFIIPEVLFFLEIKDKHVLQLYININARIKKKDYNILQSLSDKTDNELFLIGYDPSYIRRSKKEEFFDSKIIVKILKGDYINNDSKKIKDNNSNNYILLISLMHEECTKFVRKKFEETIFILQEINKFFNGKKYSFSNIKKEIISEITDNFTEFIQFYNKINGTKFGPNQSFKLKNDYHEQAIEKYSSVDINKENNLFYKFILCIEKILQLLINHYLDEIYNSNQIIKDYFTSFIEDYWSVNKLKKYLKYDNNFLNIFQNAIDEKSINNIFVLDKNYIYITVNYQVNVFYEIYFKITTNTNFIHLEKKYDFEEVKNYIDLMKVELGLILAWPERCFQKNEEGLNEVENIHTYRLHLISAYLNKIFNANKIFNIKNWKNIFYDDKLFHEVSDIKFKEMKKIDKKGEDNDSITNSINDFIINGRRNYSIDNSNNIHRDSKNYFEFGTKSINLKDENERMSSFKSLNSNISGNSDMKNLLDV